MYELVQLGKNSFCIDCPAKVGVFRMADGRAVLIDAGSSASVGRRILRILRENGMPPAIVIDTHGHADHTGGNIVMMDDGGCRVYAPEIELAYIREPTLGIGAMYGGNTPRVMQTHLLCGEAHCVQALEYATDIPREIGMLPLCGHTPGMIGVQTIDDVFFLADSIASQKTLDKYHIVLMWNTVLYKRTLSAMRNLAQVKGGIFVPSHTEILDSAALLNLISYNETILEMQQGILLSICRRGADFNEVFGRVCEDLHIDLDMTQYLIVGSTVRAMLSGLADEDLIEVTLEGPRVIYRVRNRNRTWH